MKQSIQLHVPEPCHENWNTMDRTEQGRFCNACSKEVIDFSIMTDQQILAYLSKPAAGVCGRMANSQLHRPILPVKPQPRLKWWVSVCMPLLMSIGKVAAQKKTPPVQTVKAVDADKKEEVIVMGYMSKPRVNRKLLRVDQKITGRVTDDKGMPVADASVTVKHTGFWARTDSTGYYTITIPATNASGPLSEVTLIASYVGYEEVQQEVVLKERIMADLQFTTSNASLPDVVVASFGRTMGKMVTMGAVSTISKCTIESDTLKNATKVDTLWNRITGRQPFAIYPNPVSRGQQFTVTVKAMDAYTLQVFTNSGVSLYTQRYYAAKNAPQQITVLPHWVPGLYYVRVTNEKDNKQYAAKLIIQ